ncbi:hypothetical protein BM1_07743 [Bipolaris maydis]|nr:hypothetical protein BM1_07743 [Bipolaris maydis]
MTPPSPLAHDAYTPPSQHGVDRAASREQPWVAMGWDCPPGIGAGLWMTSSAVQLSVTVGPGGWEEAFTCKTVALATALGRERRRRQREQAGGGEQAKSQDRGYDD